MKIDGKESDEKMAKALQRSYGRRWHHDVEVEVYS